ncbi:hypothetical protein F2Q70_00038433 [Brassica cretica]|nr:hypothetical protein F2Q70_00038433 [Brassica cretica]KAF2617942.1 hypothetical protein F2Q68_00039068 [Brassica cretica]
MTGSVLLRPIARCVFIRLLERDGSIRYEVWKGIVRCTVAYQKDVLAPFMR